MIFGSIRARLLALGAGLTAAALFAAWAVLSLLLAGFVERRLDAELAAAARAVMASAEWDETSGFIVTPGPADPRFEAPRSGWFWQVAEAEGGKVLARSPSLLGADLPPGGATGPRGEPLKPHSEAFTTPGEDRPLIVTVTLPQAEVQTELARIRAPLALALTVLGVALVAAQVLAVKAGLADLSRFSRVVANLRDGRAGGLPSAHVAELAPLASELERLIAARAAQTERARVLAADLAHALKTPLAVLANRVGPEDAALIARMDAMIRWHLKRARAADASLDPAARADPELVLEDLALVLLPEAERRGVRLEIAAEGAPLFRGDGEDLAEILGALAENAVQWAQSQVQITAFGRQGLLAVEIVDDGPGIAPEDRPRLLRRGARLDEAAPGHGSGHGLGLAIAADRVAAYGGRLELDTAREGGLLARVILPCAPR